MSIITPAWLPNLKEWEQTVYDGIKGFPPKWIPKPNRDRFNLERFLIFTGVEQGQYDYSEIKQRFDMLVSDKNYGLVFALNGDNKSYDSQLFYLVKLYEATLLGKIEGLRILAGDEAVMGASYSKEQSKRASKPHKLSDSEIISIKKRYQTAQNEGSVYGVIKELARRYKVSEKTISNVVNT